MKPVEPIYTVERFPPLHTALLTLLRNLSDEDWNKPTAARLWSVKDVVAHLVEYFPGEVYNLPPDPKATGKRPEGA